MSASTSQEVLMKLKALGPAITARYKVKKIGVFGSFVRGEQNANSDIDILVEFEKEADLFDLMGVSLMLEEELQRKVDVIPQRALRKEFRKTVLRETVVV